jgi:glycosyltransferase involved in cell wall biosynthesis
MFRREVTSHERISPTFHSRASSLTLSAHATYGDDSEPLVSVVMPCLDESATLAACIDEARSALDRYGIRGEIIVADNGSSDDSAEIARARGARVADVEVRGYGAALIGGLAVARGTYVVMGDADGSYDFGEIPRILEKLESGYDFVQGCRLESGGGRIMPGAMPFLHRWLGNPMFSRMARTWFDAPIHDIHCGLRGFRREAWHRLDQRCTGMEFASEMIIKASLQGMRIGEVPVVLRKDGRIEGRRPHLRTFRDGLRHLRFFLRSAALRRKSARRPRSGDEAP